MSAQENPTIRINCPTGKKVYFASDFHLGAPNKQVSITREKRIIRWLNEIAADTAHIFLVGDIFDFWFEYKNVIPKGYVRLLGKLAEFTDNGIGVSVFTGNHDMWMDGYFEEELNIPVYHKEQLFSIANKKILVAHGDGLGPGDKGYKRLKKIIRHKASRKLFGTIPPNWSLPLANRFSKTSRGITTEKKFLGEDNEWLVQYAKGELKTEEIDFFIFGHRHLPIDFQLSENSRMINLGDWINHFTYAVFDGKDIALEKYEQS